MRFVARVAGWADAARVEDLVQETWIRGVSGLPGFDWRSSLSTWLQGIALNVAREALRADRRLQLDDGAAEAINELPAGRPTDHEGRIDLERALRQLPERRRIVLVLHDLEGYTHAEIARTLGIAAGTSKSQLHDARMQLEELLTGGRT
jgi:RNA polymerase sigma factor (sigma-70 family)